jgi:hypothetical protein
MLTIGDCQGFCGLTEEELEVLAEHRRLPPIVAAELAAELLRSAKGTWLLRSYLLEALEVAVARGERERAKRLDRIISGFIAAHPVPTVL